MFTNIFPVYQKPPLPSGRPWRERGRRSEPP